jgi:hypothetical protein
MKYCTECKAAICQQCEDTHKLDPRIDKNGGKKTTEQGMRNHHIQPINEMMYEKVDSFLKKLLEISEHRMKNA